MLDNDERSRQIRADILGGMAEIAFAGERMARKFAEVAKAAEKLAKRLADEENEGEEWKQC